MIVSTNFRKTSVSGHEKSSVHEMATRLEAAAENKRHGDNMPTTSAPKKNQN